MRTRRTPRIGSAEVDRLVAGDPTGRDHRGLSALLAAAKAPASPGELAGEREAVAGFVVAYREAAPTSLPTGRHRVRIPLPARAAAVKVAAGAAVLAVGGAALAAETGHLPAGAQQHAHNLFSAVGVPAPRTTAPTGAGPTGATATGTVSAVPTTTSARPSPATAPPGTSPATESPSIHGLCQAWVAEQEPQGKQMTASAQRALATAAGGEARIAGFCTGLLSTPVPSATPKPRPSHTGKPTPTPVPTTSADGNGNGKDRTPGPRR